jgi:hypothetical protein
MYVNHIQMYFQMGLPLPFFGFPRQWSVAMAVITTEIHLCWLNDDD